MLPFSEGRHLSPFTLTTGSSVTLNHETTSHQFTAVINAQASLIQKLLQNQKYLVENLRQATIQEAALLSNHCDKPPVFKEHQRNAQIPESYILQKEPMQALPMPKKITIIQCNNQEFNQTSSELSSSVQKQDSQYSGFQMKHKSETKNVIKNFAKSIFTYIRKNKSTVRRVLEETEFEEAEFMKVFHNLKGRIHTISGLRKLWTEEGNRLHRVFRILSQEFLRKHSLNHIFNSRVQNFKVHIKYRKKMLMILERPQDFHSIKFD